MKHRILALLLCLVLISSALFLTACELGSSKTEKDGEVEVTASKLGSFIAGVDKVRKGGLTADMTIKETISDSGWTKVVNTSSKLKYNNGRFTLAETGKIKYTYSGDTQEYDYTGETYFDGSVFATMTASNGKLYKEIYLLDEEVDDLRDEFASSEETAWIADLLGGEGFDALPWLDSVLGLIDFAKAAELVLPSLGGRFKMEKKDGAYLVTFDSDAAVDAEIALLNTVKKNLNGKASDLFDALLGTGKFAGLKTELAKYHGSDRFSDLLPKLETALADSGLNVDGVYDFFAAKVNENRSDSDKMTGKQLKQKLLDKCGEMTVNDVIALGAEEIDLEGHFDPKTGEFVFQEDVSPTYDDILAAVNAFEGWTAKQAIGLMTGNGENWDKINAEGKRIDIADIIDDAVSEANEYKEAYNAKVTVTCDGKFVPTAVSETVSINTAGMDDDGVTVATLTLTAEVKSDVTVEPSAILQAEIDKVKAGK